MQSSLRSLIAAAGLALVAGAASVSAAWAQDSIKVGVSEPLTGAFAASGNYVAQGAQLAAEAINKSGGVLGKKLELIIEDNKSLSLIHI